MILTTLGCKTIYLREDYLQSPLDSNYYSADIKIGENNYNGIALAKAEANEPFIFYVGGIYSGTIEVKSIDCNIDLKKTYSNSSYTSFVIDMKENKRCLFSINIFPYFEKEISNGIKWKSIKGLVALKKEKYLYNYYQYQISDQESFMIPFTVQENDSRVFIKGCNYKHDKKYLKGTYTVTIKSSEIKVDDTCIMEGFIKSKKQNESVTVLVTKYKFSFKALPEPEITINDKTFDILADHNISFIGLGSKSVFSNYGKFLFDQEQEIVRLYSVQGRTLACKVNKEKKDYECFR